MILSSLLAFASFSAGSSFDGCKQLKSCVDCTENDYKCVWLRESGSCDLRTSLQSENELVFDDTCPVDYGNIDESFLPDWMGNVMPIIGGSTLLDISLPGTHDTLTYDLSTTVSEGGIDEMYKLAEFLHNYTSSVPDVIEDFIRSGAQTQDLTITEQLDAGIRFLDVRMMLEYSDTPAVWYSLHMMQSKDTSLKYFRDIRSWMDAHPSEVVVMWLSKHGNNCATGNDQYPYVTVEQKQAFWAEILDVFAGVAVDFRDTRLNETSIATMVERNHRAVFYVADYVQMTGYSADMSASTTPYYALDSCMIDNELGNPDGVAMVQHQRDLYAAANARKKEDKKEQRFYLASFAGGMEYVYATLLKFGKLDKLPKSDAELTAECAAEFNVPGMNWCPETLLDGSQLTNYYSQVAMDELITQMLEGNTASGLPHAIYINAIGSIDGTIRTGTEVLWGKNRSPDASHATQGFCYSDTFVLYNVLNICAAASSPSSEMSKACEEYRALLVERRARNPLMLWDDATYGRLTTW
jgi:hypothetical protein